MKQIGTKSEPRVFNDTLKVIDEEEALHIQNKRQKSYSNNESPILLRPKKGLF